VPMRMRILRCVRALTQCRSGPRDHRQLAAADQNRAEQSRSCIGTVAQATILCTHARSPTCSGDLHHCERATRGMTGESACSLLFHRFNRPAEGEQPVHQHEHRRTDGVDIYMTHALTKFDGRRCDVAIPLSPSCLSRRADTVSFQYQVRGTDARNRTDGCA
jgi:hypothetical protein